jgi:RimJ/RimL family protein N-acetyltransferase
VRFENIDWSNGSARLALGIGAADDRRQGYGAEALGLALRYAFEELNLHRLGAEAAAYNAGALRLLEKAGFQVEVRRREALYRDGRRWDELWLGLLREEWQTQRPEARS